MNDLSIKQKKTILLRASFCILLFFLFSSVLLFHEWWDGRDDLFGMFTDVVSYSWEIECYLFTVRYSSKPENSLFCLSSCVNIAITTELIEKPSGCVIVFIDILEGDLFHMMAKQSISNMFEHSFIWDDKVWLMIVVVEERSSTQVENNSSYCS